VYQVFRDCQWSKGNAEKYFIRVHIVDGELTYHVTAEKNVEKWLNEFSMQVVEAAQVVEASEVAEVATIEAPAVVAPTKKQVVAIVIHKNLVSADKKLIRKIQREIRAALGTANYRFRTFANSAAKSFDFNTPFIELHTNSVGMTETADIWDMSAVFAHPLSGVGTIKVQF
jgi:DNA-binding Lrp family transcriptional regulator